MYFLLDTFREWLISVGIYPYVMVLERISFRAIAAGVLAFFVVLAAGKPVVRWLAAKKIGDAAKFDVAALDRALASKANTPTMGGALIAAAIFFGAVLLGDLRNFYVQMALIVLAWMAALGGADDWLKLTNAGRTGARQGLYAWEKLVFQIGLGLLIGWFAYNKGGDGQSLAHVLSLPFQRTYEPGGAAVAEGLIYLSRPAYIVMMIVMISGLSNAVNITDGMDGLASGTAALVAMGLFVLCMIAGWETASQYLLVPHIATTDELAVVVGAMAGACLGFLWWNCAPAIVFMGDTGALSLGGLIGYTAVVIRQETLVLLMSGVLLAEIASVALQVGYFKATGGRRLLRCAPLHWHLHLGGWAEQKIVARLWIVSAILVAIALASIKVR